MQLGPTRQYSSARLDSTGSIISPRTPRRDLLSMFKRAIENNITHPTKNITSKPSQHHTTTVSDTIGPAPVNDTSSHLPIAGKTFTDPQLMFVPILPRSYTWEKSSIHGKSLLRGGENQLPSEGCLPIFLANCRRCQHPTSEERQRYDQATSTNLVQPDCFGRGPPIGEKKLVHRSPL